MKKITVNTFTSVYDPIEDRIRLAVNYKDINNRVDLMITRSFILNLSQTVDEFMLTHYSDSAVQEELVPMQVAMQDPANESINQTDGTDLELLKTTEELLLQTSFTINIKTKVTTVRFISKNTTAVATLNALSLAQTFQNIKSAIPYMKWGIAYDF